MNESGWTGGWTWLASVLPGAVAALGSVGCSHSCEEDFTCQVLDLGERSCPEDPADASGGDVPSECGVWVSASLGDDGNDGSQEAPVATLAQAAVMAIHGPRRVYACAERFEQSVVWPAGVALHGGFHCTGLDWRYSGGGVRTRLEAPANEVPLTLIGPVHAAPSLLTDLDITADDATTPGGSSIAVLALADSNGEIRRATLTSGKGADGADGDDGDHFGNPAKDGLHGNNGAAACTGAVGTGGEMVALDCDDDSSFGGQGGHGGELYANPGDDGEIAPVSNPQGFGLGGKGEDLAAGLFCTPGIGGAAGADGDPGLGGAWPPRLLATGYIGVPGGDGRRGSAGQGGGGGGGSAGSVAACGPAAPGGAGGGSGGTGGCGGKGGPGGRPGGASIGLAVLTGDLVLIDVHVFAGNGGRGGAGGVPQQGGQGGLPGVGGAGSLSGPNPGCIGGGGGYGGDGGHAGGGLGGPSLAVAYAGVQPPDIPVENLHHGQGGQGGPGSDSMLPSTRGQDGLEGYLEVLLP